MMPEIVTVARADSEADVFVALLQIGRMHENTVVGDALLNMLEPHFGRVRAKGVE